jgi:hypothetical protein
MTLLVKSFDYIKELQVKVTNTIRVIIPGRSKAEKHPILISGLLVIPNTGYP